MHIIYHCFIQMTEFAHSIVLFSGEDGLPLEFNIQNATEKEILRSLIEHGGGLCTLSDSAIHLASPGTKVLNVDSNKNILSSRYIFDCVKENCLLDADEYRIEINEMETSDISDNSANLVGDGHDNKVRRESDDKEEDSDDILECKPSSPPNIMWPVSNHAFDFDESGNQDNIIAAVNKENLPGGSILEVPSEVNNPPSPNSVTYVPDSLENLEGGQNLLVNGTSEMKRDVDVSNNRNGDVRKDSPICAVVVSSSQPNNEPLDRLDNILLSKATANHVEKHEDCLSQSYTVSSSADAQVSPKEPSHHTSAEMFEGNSDAPDSASLTTMDRQQYINDLEKKIEKILKKPSPKSIEDKITLVKYISCAKKLSVAVVLHTLQKQQSN